MLKNDFCDKCGQYIGNRPFTVDGIAVKDNKILLIKRKGDPFKGFWALPGGFVDREENLSRALHREIFEETSLIVVRETFLGIYSDPARHPKQLIAAVFYIETQGIPKAGDDAISLKFFSNNHLPKQIAFDHRLMIKDFLLNKVGK